MPPLKILIAPTSLCFRDMQENQIYELTENRHLELTKKGENFVLEGKPEKLYKILYWLSRDYDIEII